MFDLETYKLSLLKVKQDLETIQKEDKFLYFQLKEIYNIIDRAPHFNYNQIHLRPLKYISKEETISLVNEFLETISKDYQTNFIKAYNEGKIEFNSTKENYCRSNNYNQDFTINIKETNTLLDSYYLVHEFIHSQNLSLSYERVSFTESISIAAELLFLDFLKDKGYSTYDLNILKEERNVVYDSCLNTLKKIMPIYIIVKEALQLDAENVNKHYQDNTENLNYIECCWTPGAGLNIYLYRYVMGYVLASIFHNYSRDSSKIVDLNNAVINDDPKTILDILIGYTDIDDIPKVMQKEFIIK